MTSDPADHRADDAPELSYTNIVAPSDGVIAQRMVKQGT